ncbi:hypothetical protein BGZ65_011116 [Modicella reniformis]|uniref:Uncharacterized protein n=1 Tax=Modicella reniformis TaxID=1440133 RepID=A0A9P6LTW4_9FUNG|nr:hypothetical protein BGZ65_011116 [Modicella reniformis]
MSNNPQSLPDPATETRPEEPLDDNTSSGILVDKADYEHSSPEVSSLNSSATFDRPEDSKAEHEEKPGAHPVSGAMSAVPAIPLVPVSTSTSKGSSTAVVDLNKNMPWKLFYPIASRETILSLCKATAINLLLPFINGVFLGFGEICAHELAYRWGWTDSAHVVDVPGRRNAGNVGIHARNICGWSGIGGGLVEDELDRESSFGNRTGETLAFRLSVPMFARQVDPFAEYNSAISAAEQHHRTQQEAASHVCNHFSIQPSSQHTTGSSNSTCSSRSSDNPNRRNSTQNPHKRKHPLQFEPEFFEALDSSLEEHSEETDDSQASTNHYYSTSSPQQAGSSWPVRPTKRVKKSTLTDTFVPSPAAPGSIPHGFKTWPSPSSTSPSGLLSHNNILLSFSHNNGPSIIDLSSGEELVTLQLGDNEHKRKREDDFASPTANSLQEVFEHQDDETLIPIVEHPPRQLSPAKKVRLSKASQHPFLQFLEEGESETDETQKKVVANQDSSSGASTGAYHPESGCWSGIAARRNGSTCVRNTGSRLVRHFWDDVEMGSAHHSGYDLGGTLSSKAEKQTLILHREPKTLYVHNVLKTFDQRFWGDHTSTHIIPLEETKGKELVLYQKTPFNIYSTYSRNADDKKDVQGDMEEKEEEKGMKKDVRTHLYASEYERSSPMLLEKLNDGDDDDEGNLADDEACELSSDEPLIELEERIMDMDLG